MNKSIIIFSLCCVATSSLSFKKLQAEKEGFCENVYNQNATLGFCTAEPSLDFESNRFSEKNCCGSICISRMVSGAVFDKIMCCSNCDFGEYSLNLFMDPFNYHSVANLAERELPLKEDLKNKRQLLEKNCGDGDSKACFCLGFLTEMILKDPSGLISWYKNSCELGQYLTCGFLERGGYNTEAERWRKIREIYVLLILVQVFLSWVIYNIVKRKGRRVALGDLKNMDVSWRYAI